MLVVLMVASAGLAKLRIVCIWFFYRSCIFQWQETILMVSVIIGIDMCTFSILFPIELEVNMMLEIIL